MHNPEAPGYEKWVLNTLDFDSYTDPVAHAIEGMYQASERWSDQMRSARWKRIGGGRQKADNEVARLKLDYVRSFTVAARTVAMNSSAPEQAITALSVVMQEDEARRLQAIRKWYSQQGFKFSSEEYRRHIAMAFGDPEGITLMPNSTEPVISEETALTNYAARLDEHEHSILGYNTKIVERSTANKVGLVALGAGILALGSALKYINKK